MKNPGRIIFILLLILQYNSIAAQSSLRGKVFDCKTGDPLAFVNLVSSDNSSGTSTDIEGRFVLEKPRFPLQLNFTYVGYRPVNQWVNSADEVLRIELCPEIMTLSEVVIVPWNNPALEIMRKVVAGRDRHNPARLESYSCEAYGKLILTIDTTRSGSELNLPDSTMQRIRKLLDEQYLFLMETASERSYFKGRLTEKVTGSRISGLKDPMFVFLLSQLQSFSFYDDLIQIMDRSYLNPASPMGLRKYLFSLEDTLYQKQDTIYVIKYVPRPGVSVDAMVGLLYINNSDFAMQNVTATPADEGNGMIISIRQKYERVGGHWFPIELGSSILLKNIIIGQFYALGDGNYYLKNIHINEGRKRIGSVPSGIEIERAAHTRDTAFWSEKRVAALEIKEMRTYEMIDSLGEAEQLDHISRRLDALMRARFPLGPLEIDLKKFIRYSVYEGIYGGLGLATSLRAFPWFSLSGYMGYGYGDDELKYGGELIVPLYRPLDINFSISAAKDLRETGLIWNPQIPGGQQELNLRRLLVKEMDPWSYQMVGFSVRPLRDIQLKLFASREEFKLNEMYLKEFPALAFDGPLHIASAEIRYAIGERIMMTPHQVVSMGTNKPVFWLRFRRGLNTPSGEAKALNSIEFKASASIRLPALGMLEANFLGGMHNTAQSPSLLFNGRGSYKELTIFAPNAFATVRMNEFLADHFAYLFLTHDFKHHITSNRELPSLRIHLNAGWSLLKRDWLVSDGSRGMEDILLEGGIDIPDLVDLGLLKIGIGGFYRFGAYAYDNTKDNLAWKILLALPF